MTQSTLSTIATTFEILDYLSEASPAAPSEIGAELGVPTSTAHSYLSTLTELGYLTNEDGAYSISVSMLAIGERARRNIDLYAVGKSVVDDLAAEVQEQATLTLVEDEQPVVLYNINENENMTLKMHPGMVLPHHATVSGKLALAFTDVAPSDLESLEAYTSNTITDRDELAEDVSEVQSREVAFAYEEFKPKLLAIGVPIFYDDRLHGTLSLVGPLKQLQRTSVREAAVKELQTASNTIEVNLQNRRSA